MNSATMRKYAGGLIRYDPERRRVWLGPQRMHHGLTGALIATAGFGGFLAHLMTRRGGLEWTLLGTALMAHDWHDRTAWFRPGSQE
jgi:hypothetical protein